MELDDEVLTLLVELGVLADVEQGFQEVITQSPLPLVVAVLLTVVVVVVVALPVLDVVAPNGTRQTLPVTPAFLHAVASFTNNLYSVAAALRLIIVKKPNPPARQHNVVTLFINIEIIINLLVMKLVLIVAL